MDLIWIPKKLRLKLIAIFPWWILTLVLGCWFLGDVVFSGAGIGFWHGIWGGFRALYGDHARNFKGDLTPSQQIPIFNTPSLTPSSRKPSRKLSLSQVPHKVTIPQALTLVPIQHPLSPLPPLVARPILLLVRVFCLLFCAPPSYLSHSRFL